MGASESKPAPRRLNPEQQRARDLSDEDLVIEMRAEIQQQYSELTRVCGSETPPVGIWLSGVHIREYVWRMSSRQEGPCRTIVLSHLVNILQDLGHPFILRHEDCYAIRVHFVIQPKPSAP